MERTWAQLHHCQVLGTQYLNFRLCKIVNVLLKPFLVLAARVLSFAAQRPPRKVLKKQGKGIDFIQPGARTARLMVTMFMCLSLEQKHTLMSGRS